MRNTFLSSLSKEAIFALLFAGVALVSLSFFLFPTQTTKTIERNVAGAAINSSPTTKPVQTKTTIVTTYPTDTPTQETTDTPQTMQITIAVTPTPVSQTTTDTQTTISVSIDGVSPFTISLDKGKTQCDVLQKALSDGKINNLLMKYDSSLDAYGIYQINNLGKENQVWWTYTVNGKSPAAGCNHIAANNGDAVVWKYVGSQ